ncbi:MAG: putative LPS assembly protein LptD [Brumimicrobium sp.]
MESLVIYSCRDSIVADMKTNNISMYGEAMVEYDGIKLTADLIEMDTDKKEVYAIYTLDEEGNRVGIPKFEDGSESFTAASIRYNFDTEQGYIEELRMQQDEMHLHMGIAKRHNNEQVHFTGGKFTTCDLDEPHFHFHLTKAVMVPNKRIATGPMNLWVQGIPTPLGLPFSVIPTQEQEENGLLFPMITPVSQWGFGFQDLGYYFPIKKSDKVQTTFYGSLYSRGTFEIRNQTDYKSIYKYSGNVNLAFSSFRMPFPADSIRQQKIVIQWSHQQEAKANPYWRFNSSVNFQSDNSGKTNLDPLSQQYYQNNFNSDINLIRSFPGKPITIGLKMGLKQNSASQRMDADLPTLNVNVNRFFPFKALRKNKIGKEKFYEKIGVTYSMEAKNRTLFGDSLLEQKRYDLIGKQFQNGMRHQMTLSYPLQMFKNTLTLNTTANYNMRMNFQSIQKVYDPTSGMIVNDSLTNFGFSHDAAFQMELSTNLYTYYDFVGNNQMKMRHVLTPRVSMRFQPNMSAYIYDYLGPDNQEVYYSPYEESLYREGVGREVGLISYSFNNTFELKHRNRRDTTGQEEFAKTRIIDAFSISGNYDIFKDSLKFSDIQFQLRLTPVRGLSIVSSARLSPYGWDENNQNINIYAGKNGQGAGRITNTNISTTYTFTASENQEKVERNRELMGDFWGADFQYYAMNPHEIIDFDIPWKINLTHTYFASINTNPNADRKYNHNQNIMLSGDVSFTQRWKLGLNASYDIQQKALTQTRLSLTRDMHCWQLSFYWTPVGGQQSFLVRFNATSNLFQSAKLELRKPPEFL